MAIHVKRVYAAPAPEDGYRVLVDRLWPRGLTRERAAIDEWLRDLSPSTELRRWYGHDLARWEEFRHRYAAELAEPAAWEAVARLRSLAGQGDITLLYSSTEEMLNNAVALREYLGGGADDQR